MKKRSRLKIYKEKDTPNVRSQSFNARMGNIVFNSPKDYNRHNEKQKVVKEVSSCLVFLCIKMEGYVKFLQIKY